MCGLYIHDQSERRNSENLVFISVRSSTWLICFLFLREKYLRSVICLTARHFLSLDFTIQYIGWSLIQCCRVVHSWATITKLSISFTASKPICLFSSTRLKPRIHPVRLLMLLYSSLMLNIPFFSDWGKKAFCMFTHRFLTKRNKSWKLLSAAVSTRVVFFLLGCFINSKIVYVFKNFFIS